MAKAKYKSSAKTANRKAKRCKSYVKKSSRGGSRL